MKNKLLITSILMLCYTTGFAQPNAVTKNTTLNKVDQRGINWDAFATHPMRAMMDTALLVNKDLISILDATNSNEFNNNKATYLTRFNPLTKYAIAYKNAVNEFEKKRIENQVLEDYKGILRNFSNGKTGYLCSTIKLSDYSFEKKGFGYKPNQPGDFNKYLSDLKVKTDPEWVSLVANIAMDESVAEQFIKDNPAREVNIYGLVELSNWWRHLDFIAITSKSKNGEEKIINVYPNAATISDAIEKLSRDEVEGTTEKWLAEMDPMEFNRGSLEPIDKAISDDAEFKLENLYKNCKEYGFGTTLTTNAKTALLQHQQLVKDRMTGLKGFLKIGKPFSGFQTYPGGIKKNIIITFTREDPALYDEPSGIYWGTCKYSNGKKAIVQAQLNTNGQPGLQICFYTPEDDELGASNGNQFLLYKNQLIGYEMSDAVNYDRIVKTTILIK